MNSMRKVGMSLMICLCTLTLSGCWSSLELKKSALVMGTAVDKSGEGYVTSVELLLPTEAESGQIHTNSKILTITSANLHDAARKLIQVSKRRLVFTHNRMWILSEAVARDNILTPLDVIERDQMLRLTSYLCVTPQSPSEMLTQSLFKGMSSLELATGMQNVQYVSDFAAIDLRQFFEMINRPTHAAFLPMIQMAKAPDPVVKLEGTAIIKKDKMVGALSTRQTVGLLWIRGDVRGSSIQVKVDPGTIVQVEILKGKAKIEPKIVNGQLHADVYVSASGTLANVPDSINVTKAFTNKAANLASTTIKGEIMDCLDVLQHDYHADVTKIGLTAYRKFPKEWHTIEPNWDEVFSDARINVHVQTKISHKGMVGETLGDARPQPGFPGVGQS